MGEGEGEVEGEGEEEVRDVHEIPPGDPKKM